jgi:hypothetical protein
LRKFSEKLNLNVFEAQFTIEVHKCVYHFRIKRRLLKIGHKRSSPSKLASAMLAIFTLRS